MTPGEPATANRFLLQKDGQWLRGAQVLALMAPMLVLLVSTGIHALSPFRTAMSLSMLLVEACLITWVCLRSVPGSKPVFALSIEGGIATLDRLRPPAPGIARAALTPGRIEHAHWVPPRGSLPLPMVRLTLDPVWRLDIGARQIWAGTGGPSRPQPKYVIDPSSWPAFVVALTAACETNRRDLV